MTTSKKKERVLTELKEFLSVDPYLASIEKLIDTVKCLSKKDRARLLRLIDPVLNKIDSVKSEEIRVALVKVLIGLFPESWRIIKRLLFKKTDRHAYEVHFTLFCFLDSIQDMIDTSEFRSEIAELIRLYLENASQKTAMAAWMAGDLLGDHWLGEEAVPILIQAATQGRYVAGREGAVHGLAQISSRVSGPMLEQVAKVLQEISKKDRSYCVRMRARSILAKKELRSLNLGKEEGRGQASTFNKS